MITDEQLELNQKLIDLIDEYLDDDYYDSKALMKYLWHKGYKFSVR